MAKFNAIMKLGAGIIMAGGAAVGFGGCSSNDDSKYIVKYRTDSVIVYAPLSDQNDLHIMELDKCKYQYEMRDYKYIKRGDTISGRTSYLKEHVAQPVVPGRRGNVAIIWTVNGRSLNVVREIARRDSIMNEMKTKQR